MTTSNDTAKRREYLDRHAAQERARRQRKREAGECRLCSRPAEPGQLRCSVHIPPSRPPGRKRSDHAAYMKEYRAKCIARGQCPTCIEPAVPGRVYCAKHGEYWRRKAKEKRHARKEAGLCLGCGKAPPKHAGGTFCRSCVTRINETGRKNRYRGNGVKALDRDGHACRICGKGAPMAICVHHIDEQRAGPSANHDLDNLITLCRPCHGYITKFLHCANPDVAISLIRGEKPS